MTDDQLSSCLAALNESLLGSNIVAPPVKLAGTWGVNVRTPDDTPTPDNTYVLLLGHVGFDGDVVNVVGYMDMETSATFTLIREADGIVVAVVAYDGGA